MWRGIRGRITPLSATDKIPDTVISSFTKYALDSADAIGGLDLLISNEVLPLAKEE